MSDIIKLTEREYYELHLILGMYIKDREIENMKFEKTGYKRIKQDLDIIEKNNVSINKTQHLLSKISI